jgi:cob(I)alamin adenosyltransferase
MERQRHVNSLAKGYIQVYTGNGKGKTTAALGQALRAAGEGLTTFIVRFMKDFPYSELKSIQYLGERIRVEQYGNDTFVFDKEPPKDGDISAARQGMERARKAMLSNQYDIIILDGVCVAIFFSFLKTEDVLSLLEEKPEPVEMVLTGRYCPSKLIEKADLVTEMREIKHYYRKGVIARRGIDS